MTVRCEGCRQILGTQVEHLTLRSHQGRTWIGDTWVSYCPNRDCRAMREPRPGRAELAATIDQTLWRTVECTGCEQPLGRQIGRYFQLMWRGVVWMGRLEALTCDCGTGFVPEADAAAEARILGHRETRAA